LKVFQNLKDLGDDVKKEFDHDSKLVVKEYPDIVPVNSWKSKTNKKGKKKRKIEGAGLNEDNALNHKCNWAVSGS
jgi:hypothetical protein